MWWWFPSLSGCSCFIQCVSVPTEVGTSDLEVALSLAMNEETDPGECVIISVRVGDHQKVPVELVDELAHVAIRPIARQQLKTTETTSLHDCCLTSLHGRFVYHGCFGQPVPSRLRKDLHAGTEQKRLGSD